MGDAGEICAFEQACINYRWNAYRLAKKYVKDFEKLTDDMMTTCNGEAWKEIDGAGRSSDPMSVKWRLQIGDVIRAFEDLKKSHIADVNAIVGDAPSVGGPYAKAAYIPRHRFASRRYINSPEAAAVRSRRDAPPPPPYEAKAQSGAPPPYRPETVPSARGESRSEPQAKVRSHGDGDKKS